ncbi:hypothetical protein VHUM_01302 [Vanrija humicola]|uniref:Glycoside hydrolase family 5 domain-containing protein n=1 Tax=Vanrija humicola TaxID=5417 RepID=A0A7D8V7N0_VANHU|nr:hypothetical protein VHUM_01302 [Vanrija humicola]
MLPLIALLALVATGATASPASRAVNTGFPYGSQKIRGVNLGGWLVIEPWITPSLFDNTGNDGIVDEWTFAAYQDRGVAAAALKRHWDTFYTEADFAQIAAAGLNHVRIPVPHYGWQLAPGEPYIQGQAPYLDRAVGWARNHGLKVLIELHTAPGSQNGYDNSGHRGTATWHTNANNLAITKQVLELLSRKYSDWQVVTAIGILNEPAGYLSPSLLSTTRQFYYDAYGATRYPWAPQGSGAKSGLAIVISDAFQPSSYWNGAYQEPNFESMLLDHHYYQSFTPSMLQWSWGDKVRGACAEAKSLASSPLWLVVGEWSPAATDCAKYLNGRGIGARYDGSYPGSSYVGSCQGLTGKANTLRGDFKEFMRQYWDIQTQGFENNGQGWIMWTWKAEAADEWSYAGGLAGGWIPQNPTQHKYSYASVCN